MEQAEITIVRQFGHFPHTPLPPQSVCVCALQICMCSCRPFWANVSVWKEREEVAGEEKWRRVYMFNTESLRISVFILSAQNENLSVVVT